jgi:hypothetical protein
MNPRYPLVAQRADHSCEYCRAPELLFNFPFEVEHILPPTSGGRNEDSNLALACRSCNVFKSAHTDGFDPETETQARLFNPRADRWSDHFKMETGNGRIVGLTSIGRATVNCLQMNTPSQLAARRQWIQLGLFSRT